MKNKKSNIILIIAAVITVLLIVGIVAFGGKAQPEAGTVLVTEQIQAE